MEFELANQIIDLNNKIKVSIVYADDPSDPGSDACYYDDKTQYILLETSQYKLRIDLEGTLALHSPGLFQLPSTDPVLTVCLYTGKVANLDNKIQQFIFRYLNNSHPLFRTDKHSTFHYSTVSQSWQTHILSISGMQIELDQSKKYCYIILADDKVELAVIAKHLLSGYLPQAVPQAINNTQNALNCVNNYIAPDDSLYQYVHGLKVAEMYDPKTLQSKLKLPEGEDPFRVNGQTNFSALATIEYYIGLEEGRIPQTDLHQVKIKALQYAKKHILKDTSWPTVISHIDNVYRLALTTNKWAESSSVDALFQNYSRIPPGAIFGMAYDLSLSRVVNR